MENSRIMAGGNIPVIGKMFDELEVRKSSGLRKAIHAGADLSKELFVFDEGVKLYSCMISSGMAHSGM
jgi:hypothetical protein